MVYDLIIIGGGPAGITAGIYASRQKLKTLLITKEFGGQIARKAVEIYNYPGFEKISGTELIKKFKSHLEKQEVEIEMDEVGKVEKKNNIFLISTKGKKQHKSLSVIISSGADPRPLEVPGEKEFIGKGVGYCVTCDGPLFRNKIVAVIGGGNAGFEAAIFMTNYAKKIYILEYGPKAKADEKNQEIVNKIKEIKIMTNVALKEIKGDKFVNSLVYEDLTSKEKKELKVDGIFVEVGSQPATSFVKELVDFNERDEIKVEFETFKTKTPGLFAAGDNNTGSYKQIISACGEGCKAALAASDYIFNLKYNKKNNGKNQKY